MIDEERIKRDGIINRLINRTTEDILKIYLEENRVPRVVVE